MKEERTLEFYEKLYFSEIENKDKIHTRAQAIFGFTVITATILTYLIKNTSYEEHPVFATISTVFTLVSFALLFWSSLLLKNVMWGNEFQYCPTPNVLYEHHKALIDYEVIYRKYCDDNEIEYDDSHNPDRKLWEYITTELRECASWNTEKNELRSSNLFESTKYLVWSWIPLIIGVMLFLGADLDAASPRKDNKPNYLIVPLENVRRI